MFVNLTHKRGTITIISLTTIESLSVSKKKKTKQTKLKKKNQHKKQKIYKKEHRGKNLNDLLFFKEL